MSDNPKIKLKNNNIVKQSKLFSFLFILSFLALGFFVPAITFASPCAGLTSIDYSSQTYNLVEIGTQCWFATNLNVGTKLATGGTLPSNNSLIEKWCYSNSDANCTTYGGLYTWAEANQLATTCNDTISCTPSVPSQGICPSGWHIPTDAEIKTLEVYLGMCTGAGAGCVDATSWRGTDQGTQLKSGGTSGFNLPFAGYRLTSGSFSGITTLIYLWSASKYSAFESWQRAFASTEARVQRGGFSNIYGASVRCLKNENTAPTLTSLSAIASTDGTGEVSIISTVDDADNDELSIAYHYSSGACSTLPVTTSTISAVSSVNGTAVTSTGSYQITTVTTTPGSNIVTSTWTSQSDVPTADGSYCIYAYAYDGTTTSTLATTTVTLDNVAPGSPTISSWTITTTTIQANWNVVGDMSFYTVSSTAGTTATTTNEYYLYSILAPNTEYFWQIKTTDDYGNESSYSTVSSTLTNTPDPLSPPTLSAFTNLSTTTIQVNWGAVTGALYYTVSSTAGTVTTTNTYYNYTSLTPATSYNFQVSTRDNYGQDGSYSSVSTTFTLTPDPPATPTISSLTISSTTIQVNWGSVTGTSYYTVSSTITGQELVTTTDTNYPFASLTPNTSYAFEVIATDQYSQDSTTSTPESDYTNPAQPLSVTASANGQTLANLTWSANSNPNTTVYKIYTGTTLKGSTTNTSYAVTDLVAGTSYTFVIRAIYNSDNTSYLASEASNSITTDPVVGGNAQIITTPPQPTIANP
ncbi:MAG: hypothetical protein COY69_00005, partial [Candidatus Magasanikbacteria bacterium CG_4_10_14_0_8_um_filter_32_14]